MSIVSSVVERDGQHIVERHTDHLGGQYTQAWLAPVGWTQDQVESNVSEHATQIEVNLAEGESDQVTR